MFLTAVKWIPGPRYNWQACSKFNHSGRLGRPIGCPRPGPGSDRGLTTQHGEAVHHIAQIWNNHPEDVRQDWILLNKTFCFTCFNSLKYFIFEIIFLRIFVLIFSVDSIYIRPTLCNTFNDLCRKCAIEIMACPDSGQGIICCNIKSLSWWRRSI